MPHEWIFKDDPNFDFNWFCDKCQSITYTIGDEIPDPDVRSLDGETCEEVIARQVMRE